MRLTVARRIWLGLIGTLLLAVTSSGAALLFALGGMALAINVESPEAVTAIPQPK